jgi:hypothetical protein
MATSLTTSRVRESLDHECGCCKPGATCDGLECLCRPRFFAGQLLTDEDLRRLDHYIVAKNRLHNRYLHGTGSVCGLEVACNACDDTVTVRSGFAIGPCGEDIVVCRDTSVDVGALIREHRKQRTKVDCEPYGRRPADDCEAARQDWILGICYDEQPSRGITTLRDTGACGCSCGSCCGNGNGNGNGHSSGTKHRGDVCTCSGTRSRATPAQCEPTQICEGYRFVLTKAPPKRVFEPRPGLGSSFGTSASPAADELSPRIVACLTDLITRMRQLTGVEGSAAELIQLCCDLKAELRDIIDTSAVHDCMLGARLNDILCPDASDDEAQGKALQAIQQLVLIAIDLFRSCVCSALLPPCSVGSEDDCIPIATLTVRTADLRVQSICNWSSRRFAVNFPMLGYWLGWLPIFDTLRETVTRLCCAPSRASFQFDSNLNVRAVAQPEAATEGAAPSTERGAPVSQPRAADRPTTRAETFTQLVSQYARQPSPLSGLEATVLAALGARGEDDSDLATDLEMQNPFEALALTRLTGPAIAPVVPEQLTAAFAGLLRQEPPEKERRAAAAEEERMAHIEAVVEDLQKKVRSQARTITNLRKKLS